MISGCISKYAIGRLPKFFLFLLAAALLFSAGAAAADQKDRQGKEFLLDTYHRSVSRLENNSFGLPLFLASFEQDDRVHVDVFGIFEYPFGSVVEVLKVPANWSAILSLHPNVKACTYRKLPDAWELTLYLGRKTYQDPDDALEVIFHYRIVAQQPGYLNIVLDAEKGPYGTKDHTMRFEALSLDAGRTFVHVSYAYSDSAILRLAAKVYFATLGRAKAGFTVTGKDKKGRPVFIGGPRGSIERNAARYYFAIQAFMDTLRFPEESRFSRRIGMWYDHTSRYRKQLYEMDKKDYLTIKTDEQRGQVTLQREIGLE